eukprot:COSAG04_NODE_31389_length_257_cov_0.645570_1_plen_27_part_01
MVRAALVRFAAELLRRCCVVFVVRVRA